MLSLRRSFSRSVPRDRYRPQVEDLESRIVLSYADGNGAVITDLDVQNNGAQLVITFDGPLDAAPTNPAQSPTLPANYSVQLPAANPQVITSSLSAVAVTTASYNSTTFQVTLDLASSLVQGTFYRVFVNGTGAAQSQAAAGLIDDKGNTIDGDYDDTASGNFYALFAWTTAGSLNFNDSSGDQVTLTLAGPGRLEAWRALNGDFVATNLASQANLPAGSVQQISVVGGVLGQTVLSGSAVFAGSDSVVVVPPIAGQGITFTNTLPAYFQLTAPPPPLPPNPIVATASNLPYTIQIQQLNLTLPAVQSAVVAQDNVAGSPFFGYWLIFGGRTNGLHNFNPADPFPPQKQNFDLIVVDPVTWQTWTRPWSDTNISPTILQPLYATNQSFIQQGDSLFAVGGYGAPETGLNTFGDYKTYDTLTALSVDGLIGAVVEGGEAAARSKIQQIHDLRVQSTGSEMKMLGGQAYLVVGQSFQGVYFSPTATQTYLDEIRSFEILYDGDTPGSLAITNYQAQNDQVNFRRRDYNLADIILPSLDPALEILGGVFTPGPFGGNGYRNPILINSIGDTAISPYQQFFSQYSAPHIGLYDAGTQSMNTILLGGISLYDYDFATGQLIADTELPFVDDVTTLQQNADGTTQEFIMPSQLPGRYGAEARFVPSSSVPQYSNGVIQLDQLNRPTILGYMFGGIFSTVGNTTNQATQTSASGQVFRVVLVPTDATLIVPSPVLSLATQPTVSTVQVNGAFQADASTTYLIEVFADPTGSDPTKILLGSLDVTTDLNGNASFVVTSNLPATAGAFFTATASNPSDGTSQFSAPISLGGDANTLYVSSLYALLLNRAPDANAVGWVNQLNAGASFASVVSGIESSAEYLSDQVAVIYQRYLNRSPDPAGAQDWLTLLQSGGTFEQVAEGVVSSPEYFQINGGTNQGFVIGLYNEVLGREPSPDELSAWLTTLASGASRQSVAIGFLTSTEYRTDLVEIDYALYLLRSADPSGLSTWVAALESGSTDQDVLAGILGSTEGFEKWS